MEINSNAFTCAHLTFDFTAGKIVCTRCDLHKRDETCNGFHLQIQISKIQRPPIEVKSQIMPFGIRSILQKRNCNICHGTLETINYIAARNISMNFDRATVSMVYNC